MGEPGLSQLWALQLYGDFPSLLQVITQQQLISCCLPAVAVYLLR
jgi:hypothetical protein